MTKHYNRAPISEAVIDLRAALDDSVSQEVLRAFADQLKGQFPVASNLNTITLAFNKPPGVPGSFDNQDVVVGVRLDAPERARVLQIQRTGFTYSHMPPYSDWRTFCGEAQQLWGQYVAASGLRSVSRLAVRVINKLTVQATMAEVPKYSRLGLSLPADFRASPQTFFTQFQMNGSCWAEGCRVLVNAGAVPQSDGKVELLLDFDIFVDAVKDAAASEIWDILDKLSVAKDELFEACITDATRELIA